MLLIDLIREKEYIEQTIKRKGEYLRNIVCTPTCAKHLYGDTFRLLEDLYKQRQQYIISIERARHNTIIQLNDAKLSLVDAEIVRDNMALKLKFYEDLMYYYMLISDDYEVAVEDIKDLQEVVDQLTLDIKTLEDEINYALQNVEVSQ